MRFGRFFATSVLVLTASLPCVAMNSARRGPTSPRLFNKRSKSLVRPLGQRAIEDSRATEIQTALVSAGYLSGQPSGHWDGATESAMQKLQADNGWQTKLIPDSRAIIKLGLGPAEASDQSGSYLLPQPADASSQAVVLSQQ